MKKNELAELLKYSSPFELLVITPSNKLICLVCPIKVKVLKPIGTLKAKQIVYVSEVKITLELTTVYIIDGNAFYYYHFQIEDGD